MRKFFLPQFFVDFTPLKALFFLGKLIGKYIKVLVFFFFGDIHKKELAITGHNAENCQHC